MGAMTEVVRMKPLRWRRMTERERALAHEVFGASLDAGRVRIFALPVWNRAFVPNGRLVIWPAASAYADFGLAPLWLRSTLVHELVHVWQAQAGVFLPLAKLKAGDGPAAYAYDPEDGRSFEMLNIEQQAMVVQHAYMARHGGAAPFEQAVYSRILGAWPNGVRRRPRKI
jgi:hypothetical protein